MTSRWTLVVWQTMLDSCFKMKSSSLAGGCLCAFYVLPRMTKSSWTKPLCHTACHKIIQMKPHSIHHPDFQISLCFFAKCKVLACYCEQSIPKTLATWGCSLCTCWHVHGCFHQCRLARRSPIQFSWLPLVHHHWECRWRNQQCLVYEKCTPIAKASDDADQIKMMDSLRLLPAASNQCIFFVAVAMPEEAESFHCFSPSSMS